MHVIQSRFLFAIVSFPASTAGFVFIAAVSSAFGASVSFPSSRMSAFLVAFLASLLFVGDRDRDRITSWFRP
jgi:hypothetical protein